jgi:hypothetical protein
MRNCYTRGDQRTTQSVLRHPCDGRRYHQPLTHKSSAGQHYPQQDDNHPQQDGTVLSRMAHPPSTTCPQLTALPLFTPLTHRTPGQPNHHPTHHPLDTQDNCTSSAGRHYPQQDSTILIRTARINPPTRTDSTRHRANTSHHIREVVTSHPMSQKSITITRHMSHTPLQTHPPHHSLFTIHYPPLNTHSSHSLLTSHTICKRSNARYRNPLHFQVTLLQQRPHHHIPLCPQHSRGTESSIMQFCRPKPRKDLEPAYSSSPSSSFSSSSPHWKLSRSKH